jgi:CRISPR-associated protein Cmr6
MTLPLYREAQEYSDKNEYPQGANAGLWYNKMCNQWKEIEQQWTLNSLSKGGTETGKTRWIKTVTNNKCGNPKQIEETLERYVSLVKMYGGDVRVYRTVTCFVTGLGYDHPMENGFTWHYTLGTPYLPGSSVKGILRNWAEQWWDVEDKDERARVVDKIFGPETGNKAAGELIVFDALPVKPVQLEIEVMTPHYSLYYQSQGKDKPPADWYSPVPIPYLTVDREQQFIFGLAPRQGANVNLQQIFKWLDEALETIGAGAKTASGYGCFIHDESFKIPAVKQPVPKKPVNDVPVQPMSPIRQEMEKDGYSESNQDIFMAVLTKKWLDRMDSGDIPDAERQEIAQLLADWYQNNKPKEWEKPKPKSKNYAKVMRIKKVLGIN